VEEGVAVAVAVSDEAGKIVGMGALDPVGREVRVATEVRAAGCVPTPVKVLAGRPVGTGVVLSEAKEVALGFKEGVMPWD